MVMQTVVVIEEAVADEDRGARLLDAGLQDFRFGLRRDGRGAGDERQRNGQDKCEPGKQAGRLRRHRRSPPDGYCAIFTPAISTALAQTGSSAAIMAANFSGPSAIGSMPLSRSTATNFGSLVARI